MHEPQTVPTRRFGGVNSRIPPAGVRQIVQIWYAGLGLIKTVFLSLRAPPLCVWGSNLSSSLCISLNSQLHNRII